MKPFVVTGMFRMGRTDAPFTIETLGDDEKTAADRVLATLGSRHRVDRHHIKITSIKAISPADVQDPAVSKKIELGN